MRSVVIYESMWGNTAAIAQTIARQLDLFGDVLLVSVLEASSRVVEGADLIVVGGPTHVHGMSRASSRLSTAETETIPGAATGPGVREWLHDLPDGDRMWAAAFDTRIDKPRWLVGAASVGIAKRLRKRGYKMIVAPESFLVTDSEGPLKFGEIERADAWTDQIAQRVIEKTRELSSVS
jgi:Flavodoxin domain